MTDGTYSLGVEVVNDRVQLNVGNRVIVILSRDEARQLSTVLMAQALYGGDKLDTLVADIEAADGGDPS